VTYFQFHFLFIFPPILVLAGLAPRLRPGWAAGGFFPFWRCP
jgi:hypothetical protein